MPDFIAAAAENAAKVVAHVAGYVADSISERRNGFSDDEAADYLRCAGADALAESLPTATFGNGPRDDDRISIEEVFAARGKLWDSRPEPMSLLGYPSHCDGKCARYECVCPSDDDETVCYFCGRPTDRVVNTSDDGDTEVVCEQCSDVATASTVCDIPPSPVDEPAGVDASRQAPPGGQPELPAYLVDLKALHDWLLAEFGVSTADVLRDIADEIDPPKK